MRLTIIGNSHTVPMMRAWEAGEVDAPGVEITCFAHHGYSLAGLRREGEHLVARTDALREALVQTGGAAAIDLCGADAFALVGLGTASLMLAQFLSRTTSLSLPIGAPGAPRVSDAAQEEIAITFGRSGPASYIANQILKVSGAPLALFPGPHGSELLLRRPFFVMERWRRHPLRRLPREARPRLLALHEMVLEDFAARGALLVAQRPETIVHEVFTRARYNAARLRLENLRYLEDMVHADRRFSAFVLEDIVARLRAARAGPPALEAAGGSA